MTACPARRPLVLAAGLALAAAGLSTAGGGCAARSTPVLARAPTSGPPTWRLDQIAPVPALPTPATRPIAGDGDSRGGAADADVGADDYPPMAALLAFAQARLDRAAGRRGAAVAALRQAAAADPDSYEVHYALGRALRTGAGFDPAVSAAFGRAAELEPDHIDVQLDLARQYLAKPDPAEGLRRLRLAAQTSEYAADDGRAAEVDLLLGHALAEQHYDRAAVDRLERLVARIDRGEVRWADEPAAAGARPPSDRPSPPDEATSTPGGPVRGAGAADDGDAAPHPDVAPHPRGPSAPDGRAPSSPRPSRGGARSGDPVPADGAGSLVAHVHLLLGDLYLRQDRPADALAAYRRAEASPGGRDDPEVGARLVLGLLAVGRTDDGLRLAADSVGHFRGAPTSVAVLREAYRALGRPGGAVDALRDLHRRRPGDTAVLFALCDLLTTDTAAARPAGGRPTTGDEAAQGNRPGRAAGPATPGKGPGTGAAEAERLLAAAGRRNPNDPAVVYQRVGLRLSAGDGPGALRIVVDALASTPDLAGQLGPTWAALRSAGERGALSPETADKLAVPPGQATARAYVVWAVASRWPRSTVARAALEQAVAARPPFAPAFRTRLAELLADDDGRSASRRAAAEALVDAARAAGDPALAAELAGRVALARNDAATAVTRLTEATAGPAGGGADGRPAEVSPDRWLALALATLAAGDEAGFVDQCRRLVARFPAFDDAHDVLHAHLAAAGDAAEADRVLSAWARAWPAGAVNPAPAVARAQDRLAAGQPEAAGLALADLEQAGSASPDVLAVLDAIHQRTGQTDALAARWEARLSAPAALSSADVYHLAVRLARVYLRQVEPTDANRALDRARAAAAGEPDWLYPLAELYASAGAPAVAEQVLSDVVDLDPTATAAAVDLALAWADLGRHLGRAELLARRAVGRDPDDPRALDALGWVLYKQGRPEQAREPLARAVALADAGTTAAASSAGNVPATGGGDSTTSDAANAGDAARTVDPGPADGGKPPPAVRRPARGGGRPDPSVLDHLGDVLYRLGDRDGAGRAWDRCRQRLADEDAATAAARADRRSLRLALPRKLQQLRDGQAVQVSAIPPPSAVSTP